MGDQETFAARTKFVLLPLFIFAFSNTVTFAENLEPEATPTTKSISTQYIQTLETAINDYEKIAANGGWPAFPIGKTIKAGAKDTRIPIARQILSVMGDYKEEKNDNSENKNDDSDKLDKSLAEAVKHFQSRHGLEADGTIGSKTQAALSINIKFRLAQMHATLEHMREMPELGERYVLVNVPGFYLRAVNKNETALTSRIIVGTPKNATPLFHRPITDVSFNPAWHVPERIARNELMDKLRSDPDYFIKGNYVVKDHNGEIVNAMEIDWENQPQSQYRFTQQPGSGNALGKVKFNLPDTGNIYLHSTASPQLFNKAERALSHGCIRVELARELAYFVVDGLKGWNTERIAKLYDSGTSKIMPVTPVPVYLAYWTSWVDEATGKLHFQNDIYGRDKKRVSEILAKLDGGKNETEIAMK